MENFDVNALKGQQQAGGDGSAGAGASSSAEGTGGAAGANAGAEGGAAASNQQANAGAEGANAGAAAAAAAKPEAGAAAPEKTEAEIAADKKKLEEDAAAAALKDGKPTGSQDKPASLSADDLKKLALADLLKEAGVENMEELKEKLKPKTEATDEEKAAAVQKYESNLDNFAVTNKLMSRDEIVSLANLSKADATTIAMAEFTKEFKAAKADATDVEIQQAFKLFYNTESEDLALKAIGQKEIDKKATQARAELEGKRAVAKADFDNQMHRKAQVPAYKQAIQTSIKENLPESVTLLSHGETPIVYKPTPEDITEIEKLLVSEETFSEFLKSGNSQQMKALLKDKVDGLLFLKNREKIFKTIFEAGQAVGGKEGSNVGATASFANNQNGSAGVEVIKNDKELTEADIAKLGSVFNKLN